MPVIRLIAIIGNKGACVRLIEDEALRLAHEVHDWLLLLADLLHLHVADRQPDVAASQVSCFEIATWELV